jgi:hypothetical protein
MRAEGENLFATTTVWERMARTTAQMYGMYIAVANRVGVEGGVTFAGGSLIVGPDSRVLAGPLGPEESILYADLDLEAGIRMKLRHDFAGHYNRPDVFQMRVNARRPELYGRAEGDDVPPPALDDTALYLDRVRRAHELPEASD